MKYLINLIRCFFILAKGGDSVLGLDFYIAYAIMTGNAKWEDVQEPWKPAVKRWLDAYGFGTDGKPLPKNA